MRAFLLAGIASLAPLSAWSCDAPAAPPAPPSGASATREAMIAAQAAIKGYNTAVAAYTECMKKTNGNEKDALAVLAQLQKLAEQFNAELRTFKQRNAE